MVFTVCYQSLHAFSHVIKNDSINDHSHSESNKNVIYKISEKDDCPVCEFKFASFLISDIYSFPITFRFEAISYLSNSKESFYFFKFTIFSPRGPPN